MLLLGGSLTRVRAMPVRVFGRSLIVPGSRSSGVSGARVERRRLCEHGDEPHRADDRKNAVPAGALHLTDNLMR
jgi:hypothetical protein